jgi:uncharacterized protein with von Willebrand factor type A (vWA) domain
MTNSPSLNGELFERLQTMHRLWLERQREIRQIESDFGTKLLASKTPPEAATICNEWMAARLERVTSDQKTFTNAWLGLISDLMASTATMFPSKSLDDQKKSS